jgi:hypothetical protein
MQIMSNAQIIKEFHAFRRDGNSENRAIELVANRYMMTVETAKAICLSEQKAAA